jgi:Transposase
MTEKLRESHLKIVKKSLLAVAIDFNKDEIHKILSRTVRRGLNEAGLKGRRARKKLWLSADNIKTRLAWAKNFKRYEAMLDKALKPSIDYLFEPRIRPTVFFQLGNATCHRTPRKTKIQLLFVFEKKLEK